MYEPIHFRVEDTAAAFRLVRENPLGLLISRGAEGIIADPLPFLLEEEQGQIFLRAHVARPNPQWRALTDNPEALVVFQGIDHYVTPEWYATKRESGKVVPTWNYQQVQMRGQAEIRHDRAFLLRQITALTAAHEAGRTRPWTVADAPADYTEVQMRAIVGIEIRVEHWCAKFKLSQNRNAADHAGVVAGLAASGTAASLAMAAAMAVDDGKKLP